jgi:hypothetical protein
MSLFSTPKVKPDKAAQAAAIRQQALADNQLTDALQSVLTSDTRAQLRAFGLQPDIPFYRGGGGYGGGTGGGGGGYGGGRGGGGFR